MTFRYGRYLRFDEEDPDGQRTQDEADARARSRARADGRDNGTQMGRSEADSRSNGREPWNGRETHRSSAYVTEQLPRRAPRFAGPPWDPIYPAETADRPTQLTRNGAHPRPAPPRSAPTDAPPASSGWIAGLVWLAAGAGLCLDGLAVELAWRSSPLSLALFWAAIIIPFAVFAIVLMVLRPSSAIRQFTVCLIGVYPAAVYRMSSPFVLGGFDEHLHERTLDDLLRGGGLFAPNPLLTVSPHYPGLELLTGVAVRITGIPVILGISLTVFICRVILVLAIYYGAAAVTNSHRRASLAVLFYAVSPQFYFFNSQFSYQTLALALGLAGLVLLYHAQVMERTEGARVLAVIATLALLGTVVTHHATSWIMLAFLLIWTVAARAGQRTTIACVTGIVAVAVAGWTTLNLHVVSDYMAPIGTGILRQFSFGAHLFHDAAGTALPLWERVVLLIYAVACTCAALICGWRVLKMASRERSRMLGFIALGCLAYPATLAAHFEPMLAQYGDRASTFMFLPVALCWAIVVRGPKAGTHRNRPQVRRRHIRLVGAVTFAYLGGVILGSGPAWGYLPGTYLVSADSRSQDPETLAAVQWAAEHLPPGSRIVADRTPADLLAAEARLWPVTKPLNGLTPAALYFKVGWPELLTTIVRQLDIRYIYVDTRLGDSLPHYGYYISQGETSAPVQIALQALSKFAGVQGITTVFRDGPITIYDTSGLGGVRNQVTGFVSPPPKDLSPPLSAALGVLFGLALASALYFLRRRRAQVSLNHAVSVGQLAALVTVAMVAGAALFALRVEPGPAFHIAALATLVVSIAAYLIRNKGRAVRPVRLAVLVHPLVLLGTVAVAAGAFIGVRASWLNEVKAVEQILHWVHG